MTGSATIMNDKYCQMINQPATLVFRTIHYDRAGETGDDAVIKAEIADVAPDGRVLLATRQGVFVHFPVEALFQVNVPKPPKYVTKFIGGQEMIRDFHPADEALRTQLRWMQRDEVEALLKDRRKT